MSLFSFGGGEGDEEDEEEEEEENKEEENTRLPTTNKTKSEPRAKHTPIFIVVLLPPQWMRQPMRHAL